MMKKYLTVVAIILSISFSNAKASEFYSNPYIGAEYSYGFAKMKYHLDEIFENSGSSASAIFGYRASRYFGFEGFYQQFLPTTKTGDGYESEAKFYAYGFDLIGYVPTEDLSFAVLFSGGVGEYTYEAEYKSQDYRDHYKDTNTGMRVGIGMQYNFSRNFAIRTMVRHILSASEYVNNMTEVSGGFVLTF